MDFIKASCCGTLWLRSEAIRIWWIFSLLPDEQCILVWTIPLFFFAPSHRATERKKIPEKIVFVSFSRKKKTYKISTFVQLFITFTGNTNELRIVISKVIFRWEVWNAIKLPQIACLNHVKRETMSNGFSYMLHAFDNSQHGYKDQKHTWTNPLLLSSRCDALDPFHQHDFIMYVFPVIAIYFPI